MIVFLVYSADFQVVPTLLLQNLSSSTSHGFVYYILQNLLSCQQGVTVMSCFVYKVIRDLKLIDHLCINPICRIGLIYN